MRRNEVCSVNRSQTGGITLENPINTKFHWSLYEGFLSLNDYQAIVEIFI